MAIQLNDRDHLIFKLINEHQVLLEKHISWFISGDDKPVLIRDRLRKLFYLDYLLCHRHGTKLPWWTTPTKPLVYMLSSMTRNISGFDEQELDLFDSDVQRHLLEVANVRMLFLVGVRDGLIQDFEWNTIKATKSEISKLDATATFSSSDLNYKVGVINHPAISDGLVTTLEQQVQECGLDKLFIVSRDDVHQVQLQKLIATSPLLKSRCLFSTHHELYRVGVVISNWQTCDASVAAAATKSAAMSEASNWSGGLVPAPISISA
jgi:hypothetical protein